VGRDVALAGDETSTSQEIAKIINQGLLQEWILTSTSQEIAKIINQGLVQEWILTNSKMLSYIQHILQRKPSFLFFFFLIL